MTATVERPPRNGGDVPTLFATLDAVKSAPEMAQFQFRATNDWLSGWAGVMPPIAAALRRRAARRIDPDACGGPPHLDRPAIPPCCPGAEWG